MRTMLRSTLAIAGLTLGAGAAHAQAVSAPPAVAGPDATLVGSEARDFRGGDAAARSAEIARDEAIARGQRAERTKAPRAVPAKPGDIAAGAEVRDSKGVVIGTVESVAMADAVVSAPGGKVAVPLEAFGKDRKGLLIGITKADFDAMVASANAPAN
ncbi:hypothetical protein ACFQ1E_04255 [Sphingomonas canadensis]|uniref:PRC-barrel domain-containing protein n=1 Tax=Sphingomonas canadensis TaxID=1219257 RepID=A0ABW3H7Y3_9SPHN|nr:hypothetical protein [Sphingomonas canadensis]MCW3834543.1 hypothetical protein [Sphingomonas canadensis]